MAVMGLEQIDFFWYVGRISGLALLGYVVRPFTSCSMGCFIDG